MSEVVDYFEHAATRRKRGAQSTYSDEIADEILMRIAEGESLTEICESPGMPSLATWYVWLNARPDLQDAYAQAREVQAHTYASKVVQVARTATDAGLGRLEVDALKWAASKLAPKLYGEATQIRHADAEGNKLDTKPLVNELLSLMGGASVTQAPIESTARDVTPRVPLSPPTSKPAYRPKARPADDVDDLV